MNKTASQKMIVKVAQYLSKNATPGTTSPITYNDIPRVKTWTPSDLVFEAKYNKQAPVAVRRSEDIRNNPQNTVNTRARVLRDMFVNKAPSSVRTHLTDNNDQLYNYSYNRQARNARNRMTQEQNKHVLNMRNKMIDSINSNTAPADVYVPHTLR